MKNIRADISGLVWSWRNSICYFFSSFWNWHKIKTISFSKKNFKGSNETDNWYQRSSRQTKGRVGGGLFEKSTWKETNKETCYDKTPHQRRGGWGGLCAKVSFKKLNTSFIFFTTLRKETNKKQSMVSNDRLNVQYKFDIFLERQKSGLRVKNEFCNLALLRVFSTDYGTLLWNQTIYFRRNWWSLLQTEKSLVCNANTPMCLKKLVEKIPYNNVNKNGRTSRNNSLLQKIIWKV